MEDLARWLGEQLDEDERITRAATERQPYDEWDAVGDDREGDVARKHWSVVKIARMEQIPAARDLAVHIARHDPARVLREIDAKRRIVYLAVQLPKVTASTEMFDNNRDAWAEVLKQLALPYADRPGYREDWRP